MIIRMPDASEIISRRKADAVVTGATNSNRAHSLQGSITKRLLNLGRQPGVSGGGGGGGGPVVNHPPVSSFTLVRANDDYFDVSWTYANTGPSVFVSFKIFGMTKAAYEATSNPAFDALWQLVDNESTRWVAAPSTLPLLLSSGTDYVLRIIVYYSTGVSTPADLHATTRSPPTLSPPTNFQSTGVAATTIAVSWTAPSPAPINYTLTRTNNGSSTDFSVNSGTSYTYTGLTASTAYTLAIKANYSGGSSVVVALAPVTTSAPPAPTLSPPTNFTRGTVTATTIDVSWTAPAPAPINYTLTRTNNGNSTDFSVNSGTSYTYTGLTASTEYTLAIKANYSGGSSVVVALAPVTTSAPPAPTLSPPTNFTRGTVTATTIDVSWTAPAPAPINYTLTRTNNGNSTDFSVNSGTSYTYTGLTASTEYTLAIKANYSGGSSVVVALAPVTTSAPPAPTNFQSTGVAATTIDVSWTAPSPAPISYNMYYGETNTFGGAISILLASSSAESYTYDFLTASTAYYLWIKANYSGGSSAVVTLGPVTTSAPPAPPPTVPNVTNFQITTPSVAEQLTVTWSNYSETIPDYEFSEYQFFISTDDSKPSIPALKVFVKENVTTVINSTSSIGYTPLLSLTQYYVWVQVVWKNNAEEIYSEVSQPISVITIETPPPPQSFAAFNIGSTDIDVSWEAPEDSDYTFNNYSLGLTTTADPPTDEDGTTIDLQYKFGVADPLQPETDYYVWVSAVYNEITSESVMLGPLKTLVLTETVEKVTGLTATKTTDSITISWDASAQTISGDAFGGYKLYFANSPSIPDEPEHTMTSRTDGSYSFSGLEENTYYYIWVVVNFENAGDSQPVALLVKTNEQT